MDLSRRELLRLGALASAGLAGCASDPRFGGPGTVDRPVGAAGVTPTESPAPTSHPLPSPDDPCSADPTLGLEDPTTVQADAREQLRCAGRPFDTFETLEPWTAESGSLAAVDESFTGTQAAHVEAGPGEDRARIVRSFPGGLDLSGQDLSLAVRLDEPGSQGVVLRLDAPDHRNTLLLGRRVYSAGWVRLDLGPSRVVGDPDLTDVREVSVQAYTGGDTDLRLTVDSLRRRERTGPGRVLLTFDGALASQHEQAFPLMEAHDVPGVVSVQPGTTRWSGRIGRQGLRELQAAGWDVVARPRTPTDLRAASPGEQVRRLRRAKEWLLQNGFEAAADVLVWPRGRYDRGALRVASRYYRLAFGGGGVPFGMVSDPLVLPRVDGRDAEAAAEALDLAARYDQTVALSFNAVGNMRTGMSLESFEEVLQRVADSPLEVVTVTRFRDAVFGDE